MHGMVQSLESILSFVLVFYGDMVSFTRLSFGVWQYCVQSLGMIGSLLVVHQCHLGTYLKAKVILLGVSILPFQSITLHCVSCRRHLHLAASNFPVSSYAW